MVLRFGLESLEPPLVVEGWQRAVFEKFREPPGRNE